MSPSGTSSRAASFWPSAPRNSCRCDRMRCPVDIARRYLTKQTVQIPARRLLALVAGALAVQPVVGEIVALGHEIVAGMHGAPPAGLDALAGGHNLQRRAVERPVVAHQQG